MRNGAGFAAPLELVRAHVRAIVRDENLALAEALRASRRAKERARRFALSAAEVERLESFGKGYLVSDGGAEAATFSRMRALHQFGVDEVAATGGLWGAIDAQHLVAAGCCANYAPWISAGECPQCLVGRDL